MERMRPYLIKYEEPELDKLFFESYRLNFGHVFWDTSHIIRIENNTNQYRIVHKKLVSDSDSSAIVIETIKNEISPQDWGEFVASVYKTNFWTMQREINRVGFDGGNWLIEGRRPSAERCDKRGYHMVIRWSPEEGSEFHELAEKLLEIADFQEMN